jgi:hypothetical protein
MHSLGQDKISYRQMLLVEDMGLQKNLLTVKHPR